MKGLKQERWSSFRFSDPYNSDDSGPESMGQAWGGDISNKDWDSFWGDEVGDFHHYAI